ncbi:SDR family NAD(P)-dependent oxidoreductase [Aromatoleum petrolei]|uniref:Glucose 1-dehydrogenase n=1 Tax=Aromatoleum petrolei TaxID=76116 RepID=A0ABX1MKV8_9RHOO|nr:SDR family NAD(P)-dependent oxidoreductase [Aromatoleum petrolei]NMF88609.1 glucose 1-dehydrogenase [Aromatoleum petrolei]QTQ34682.1 Short-chain dehydrogenase/reductase [Aromatoleum petrolei]
MNFEGKNAIVTGGAQGLGFECARRLAAAGARVVIADLNREAGEQAVAQLHHQGAQALALVCDVANAEAVNAMVTETVAAWGGIDVLINNAGVHCSENFLDTSEQEIDRLYRINVKGTFLPSQHVARHMVQTGRRGRIVNISSIQAVLATFHTAYGMSKAAVGGLTRSMAISLAPHGIRVNAVGAGPMRTPMMAAGLAANPALEQVMLNRTPLGRFADPSEMASVACFLASDDASFMTGQTVYVDGGRLAQNFAVPVSQPTHESH